MGFFDNLKEKFSNKDKEKYLSGFANTNKALGAKLKVMTDGKINKHTFMEDLMITLLESDLGYHTANKICDYFIKEIDNYVYLNQQNIFEILHDSLKNIYGSDEKEIH